MSLDKYWIKKKIIYIYIYLSEILRFSFFQKRFLGKYSQYFLEPNRQFVDKKN